MAMTESDLRSFSDFAEQKLRNGGSPSLEVCLSEWRDQQAGAADLESIRRGLDDANSGRLRDFGDVDAEIRRKYDITETA